MKPESHRNRWAVHFVTLLIATSIAGCTASERATPTAPSSQPSRPVTPLGPSAMPEHAHASSSRYDDPRLLNTPARLTAGEQTSATHFWGGEADWRASLRKDVRTALSPSSLGSQAATRNALSACEELKLVKANKQAILKDRGKYIGLCLECLRETKELYPKLVTELQAYAREAIANDTRTGSLLMNGGVFFASGRYAVSAEGTEYLRSVATYLNHEDALLSNKEIVVTVIGYADEPDPRGINVPLSRSRAGSVAKSLRDMGVQAHRITVQWEGFRCRSDLPFSTRAVGQDPWNRCCAIRFGGAIRLGPAITKLRRLAKKAGVPDSPVLDSELRCGND